jgi:hypothetical protein
MAETGQIKIFGDHPSRTEAALAKTRRHLYKEERLTYIHRILELLYHKFMQYIFLSQMIL